MQKMLGSLRNSANSLKISQDELGKVNFLGSPIQVPEGDLMKINENIYKLTPQVFRALTDPFYTGNTMKNDDDFLLLYNILKDVNYTGNRDCPSNRKKLFTINLPKNVSQIQNIRFFGNTDDSVSDLEGQGVKIIIPSNIIVIYPELKYY